MSEPHHHRRPAAARRLQIIAIVVVAVVLLLVVVITGARGRSASTDAVATDVPTPRDLTSTQVSPAATRSSTAAPSPASTTPAPSAGSTERADWSSMLHSGPWQTSHVQGIAVDGMHGFIYYSFTTLLVKTDLHGKLVGTVEGFTGHLGDLELNPDDGKLYGSLEYKDARAFYIAIFDVGKINRVGMKAEDAAVLKTVYLPTVVSDFTADLNRDGVFDGDTAHTADHRYGCSGIDGVTFGPQFGKAAGPNYLTVAYGIYENARRNDNDHQVLLQYDISDWSDFAQPLHELTPHRHGPAKPDRMYFVYTGNTFFGVQNLEYVESEHRWLLAVYPAAKPAFPNYALFAVDATAEPEEKRLKGLDGRRGLLLPLSSEGLVDKSTGIRGWRRDVGFGVESLGGDLFYVVTSNSTGRPSSARLQLSRWTGKPSDPFIKVRNGRR